MQQSRLLRLLKLFAACSGLGDGEDEDGDVATSARAVDGTAAAVAVSDEGAVDSSEVSRAEGGGHSSLLPFFEANELAAAETGNWFGFWMQFPMTHNGEI